MHARRTRSYYSTPFSRTAFRSGFDIGCRIALPSTASTALHGLCQEIRAPCSKLPYRRYTPLTPTHIARPNPLKSILPYPHACIPASRTKPQNYPVRSNDISSTQCVLRWGWGSGTSFLIRPSASTIIFGAANQSTVSGGVITNDVTQEGSKGPMIADPHLHICGDIEITRNGRQG